jgi:hypothetical protein
MNCNVSSLIREPYIQLDYWYSGNLIHLTSNLVSLGEMTMSTPNFLYKLIHPKMFHRVKS